MGTVALKVCEGRLANNDWLAEKMPTIADIACYPYIALTPEAGLTLDDYPGIERWIRRIQSLPGYVELPVDRPAA
jgi:glutathione S-transferase